MLWVDLVAERGRGLAALSDSLPGVGEQSVEQVRGERGYREAAQGAAPGRLCEACASSRNRSAIGIVELMTTSNESELIAQALSVLEARVTELEKVIRRLEIAAETTARALEEVSAHWDAVYRAMRREE